MRTAQSGWETDRYLKLALSREDLEWVEAPVLRLVLFDVFADRGLVPVRGRDAVPPGPKALARESLSLCEKEFHEQWATINLWALLGAALVGQKKYAAAEAPLLAGYEGLTRRYALERREMLGATGVWVGVAVGGTGVFVGVAVGGTGVFVGVAVGGTGVFVGVPVGVGVGGTGVLVLVGVGVEVNVAVGVKVGVCGTGV